MESDRTKVQFHQMFYIVLLLLIYVECGLSMELIITRIIFSKQIFIKNMFYQYMYYAVQIKRSNFITYSMLQ